jgi:hypothetical protein
VDEKNEVVYFSGNKGNHTQRHFFMASFSTQCDPKGESVLLVCGVKRYSLCTPCMYVCIPLSSSLEVPPTCLHIPFLPHHPLPFPLSPSFSLPLSCRSSVVRLSDEDGWHTSYVHLGTGWYCDMYRYRTYSTEQSSAFYTDCIVDSFLSFPPIL